MAYSEISRSPEVLLCGGVFSCGTEIRFGHYAEQILACAYIFFQISISTER